MKTESFNPNGPGRVAMRLSQWFGKLVGGSVDRRMPTPSRRRRADGRFFHCSWSCCQPNFSGCAVEARRLQARKNRPQEQFTPLVPPVNGQVVINGRADLGLLSCPEPKHRSRCIYCDKKISAEAIKSHLDRCVTELRRASETRRQQNCKMVALHDNDAWWKLIEQPAEELKGKQLTPPGNPRYRNALKRAISQRDKATVEALVKDTDALEVFIGSELELDHKRFTGVVKEDLSQGIDSLADYIESGGNWLHYFKERVQVIHDHNEAEKGRGTDKRKSRYELNIEGLAFERSDGDDPATDRLVYPCQVQSETYTYGEDANTKYLLAVLKTAGVPKKYWGPCKAYWLGGANSRQIGTAAYKFIYRMISSEEWRIKIATAMKSLRAEFCAIPTLEWMNEFEQPARMLKRRRGVMVTAASSVPTVARSATTSRTSYRKVDDTTCLRHGPIVHRQEELNSLCTCGRCPGCKAIELSSFVRIPLIPADSEGKRAEVITCEKSGHGNLSLTKDGRHVETRVFPSDGFRSNFQGDNLEHHGQSIRVSEAVRVTAQPDQPMPDITSVPYLIESNRDYPSPRPYPTKRAAMRAGRMYGDIAIPFVDDSQEARRNLYNRFPRLTGEPSRKEEVIRLGFMPRKQEGRGVYLRFQVQAKAGNHFGPFAAERSHSPFRCQQGCALVYLSSPDGHAELDEEETDRTNSS